MLRAGSFERAETFLINFWHEMTLSASISNWPNDQFGLCAETAGFISMTASLLDSVLSDVQAIAMRTRKICTDRFSHASQVDGSIYYEPCDNCSWFGPLVHDM